LLRDSTGPRSALIDLVLLLVLILTLGAASVLVHCSLFAQRLLRQVGEREPQIDGLRGMCAMWVALHHLVFVCFWKIEVYSRWLGGPVAESSGKIGVAMFFLICAYLFWGRLSGPGFTGWRGWLAFLSNRVRRIVPMYVVAVTAALLLLGLLGRPFDSWLPASVLVRQAARAYSFWFFPAQDFNNSLGAKASLGLAWTLRYEWLFYAWLPLLALVRARRWWWVLLPAALLFNHLVVHDGWIDFFIYGSAARELSRLPSVQRFARSPPGAAVSMSLVAGVACLVDPDDLAGRLPALLLSIAFLLVVAGSDWFGILTSRGARLVGVASYSVYLLNIVVEMPVVYLLLPGSPVLWPAYLQVLGLTMVAAVLVLVSLATYWFVERPFQRPMQSPMPSAGHGRIAGERPSP
jgi:peptidoglycan/LPS O-acetylase OafA/YrhL